MLPTGIRDVEWFGESIHLSGGPRLESSLKIKGGEGIFGEGYRGEDA